MAGTTASLSAITLDASVSRFRSSGARKHDYFSDTELDRGAKARGMA